MGTRAELLEAVGGRYRVGTRAERSRILDEFAAVTGYHRKHAIRLLAGSGEREEEPGGTILPCPPRSRRYGPEVRDALIQLWEVSDRVCGKRLRPMLPVLLPALERHGKLELDEATRTKLLAVSAASIDRLLAGVRAVAGGGRRRPVGFGSAVRRSVPVRTFNDWGDPAPGWVEADFVAHQDPDAWRSGTVSESRPLRPWGRRGGRAADRKARDPTPALDPAPPAPAGARRRGRWSSRKAPNRCRSPTRPVPQIGRASCRERV